LNGLLDKLGEAERKAKRIYYITGQLVSSDLKDMAVDGYYMPTKWGFMHVESYGKGL
jgi:methylmalonyl-CoA mutase cobalamin-binding subunit